MRYELEGHRCLVDRTTIPLPSWDPRFDNCRIITDSFVPLLALCTRREAVQVGRTCGHILPTLNDARIFSSAQRNVDLALVGSS